MRHILTTLLTSTAVLGAGAALAATDSAQTPNDFCATGFVAGDTDADGFLSQAEIKKMRDVEFGRIDADGDGMLSREEYRDCFGLPARLAGEQAAKDETDELETAADWTDLHAGDRKQLSAEEWAERAREAWKESPASARDVFTYNDWVEKEEHYARAAINRFQQQDQNGDGILTQKEYETLGREVKFDDKALEERFNARDVNEDGVISPQEYRAAGTWMAEPAALNTEVEAEQARAASVKRFQRNDRDGDGVLSMEEFANSERGGQYSEEKLKTRFDTLDADNSGGISPQEYRPAATWMAEGGALGIDGQASGDTDDAGASNATETEAPNRPEKIGVVPVYYYFIEIM